MNNLKLVELYSNWPRDSNHLTAETCSDILQRARDEGLAATFHPLFLTLPDNLKNTIVKHSASYVTFANKQRLTLIKELLELEQVFAGCGYQVLLVKGAAYRIGGFAYAQYRLFSDIDLLVHPTYFQDAVRRLIGKGYIEHTYSEYERNYYINWSHQYPPLRHMTRSAEVDLHHSIFFAKSKIKIDIDRFISNATQVSGSVFSLPTPADMFVHACLHLFYQEEQQKMTKDLIDLHCLYKEVENKTLLIQSASICNKSSAIAYGLLVQSWYFKQELSVAETDFIVKNTSFTRRSTIHFMLNSILQQKGLSFRFCSLLWFTRGHLIKMNLPTLIYHSVMKLTLASRQRIALGKLQKRLDEDALPDDARQ